MIIEVRKINDRTLVDIIGWCKENGYTSPNYNILYDFETIRYPTKWDNDENFVGIFDFKDEAAAIHFKMRFG